MKRIFITTSLLCFSVLCFSQSTEQLIWSTKKLASADFKAEPDENSPFKALSSTGFGYSYKYNNDSLIVETVTHFKPQLSWIKKQDADLLAHEQLHFDITEYFRRLFLIKLAKTPIDINNVKPVIQALYAEVRNELRTWQGTYDEQSDHSVNKEQQQKWAALITEKLNQTNAATTYKMLLR
jgi:hypothetical protein